MWLSILQNLSPRNTLKKMNLIKSSGSSHIMVYPLLDTCTGCMLELILVCYFLKHLREPLRGLCNSIKIIPISTKSKSQKQELHWPFVGTCHGTHTKALWKGPRSNTLGIEDNYLLKCLWTSKSVDGVLSSSHHVVNLNLKVNVKKWFQILPMEITSSFFHRGTQWVSLY